MNLVNLPWGLIVKIIIIIIIIIIIWILWRKYGSQLTQARNITLLEREGKIIDPAKRSEIESIGQQLYNDIYDTPITGHVYTPYSSALALTDVELEFLASYYRKYLGNGNTLYSDIQSQYYITSGIPAQLLTRLAAIGRR